MLEVWEEKSVGIGNVKQEYIFITPIREPIEPFQLHGDTYWHEVIMKLDIRTYSTIARHKAVVAEVARIVKNIVRNTDDGFLDVIIMGIDPKTPDVRNIFRDVLTLRYRSAESHTFV